MVLILVGSSRSIVLSASVIFVDDFCVDDCCVVDGDDYAVDRAVKGAVGVWRRNGNIFSLPRRPRDGFGEHIFRDLNKYI